MLSLAGARYTGGMHPPVRLVAIDMDGTLLPTFAQEVSRRNAQAMRAAQAAGITVAIATGRRTAYTAPLWRAGPASGYAPDYVKWSSDADAGRRAHRPLPHGGAGGAGICAGCCGRLGPWSLRSTGRARGELVLEDLEQAHGRIAMWVEANRDAIEVVEPLE